MGLRDAILAAADLRQADVEVPEWGVTVRLKEPTAAARIAYQDALASKEGGAGYLHGLSLLLVACAIDPATGDAAFSDTDIEALKAKSLHVLKRLGDKALEVMRHESLEVAAGN